VVERVACVVWEPAVRERGSSVDEVVGRAGVRHNCGREVRGQQTRRSIARPAYEGWSVGQHERRAWCAWVQAGRGVPRRDAMECGSEARWSRSRGLRTYGVEPQGWREEGGAGRRVCASISHKGRAALVPASNQTHSWG